MPETRTTFEALASWEVALWYGIAAVSTAIFFWGAFVLIRKYRRGRGRTGSARLIASALSAVTQSRLWRSDPTVGLGHVLIFYGFVALFIGTVVLALDDDITKPLLGFDFWHDGFYLVYSFLLDIFGAGFLVGLAVMAAVRGFIRPKRLDYARVDSVKSGFDRNQYVIGDWIFLGSLTFLVITGFVLEALRIAVSNPDFEVWSPVGWALGQVLRAAGIHGTVAEQSHHVLWWIHGIVALAFVSAIPFTKAVHMAVSPANLVVSDSLVGKRLLPPESVDRVPGYASLSDFSWNHLLSLDACTKCGRCHEACPATAGGYPLSPRDLILDLREAAEGSTGPRSVLHIKPLGSDNAPLVGPVIRPETIWSCMQCMACVTACPVGIEHVPIINNLRRPLFESGEIEPQLQTTMERIQATGNSFGESRRRRAGWTRELGFEVKNIRQQPAELLWFLGDYASFDPRNQRVTRLLARILKAAGVDFGILFDAESTAGCDVRRAGEESLWMSLAEHNIATLRECRFERIMSSDPHTFHTLKNEYPSLGGSWGVFHHTEVLTELVRSGRLRVRGSSPHRVTYHDPCMLGRYNGIYEAPRALIKDIGEELVEMPRNRANSFCCGAGGGRIWMQELAKRGQPRPSEQRIAEAVSLGGIDYFVVACPKDVTMYEDAIKTSGNQDRIQLREVTELLAAAMGES